MGIMSYLSAPGYAEPVVGFRSLKAAQLCAWFAVRAGGYIEKLKLIKLIYLSEREHLVAFEDSMLLDELYSLPHGPICSGALNGIDGVIHKEIWDNYIARNGNIVVALRNFSRQDLDDLSEVDVDMVEAVWKRFGHMTASQVRNWTHQNCPEYTELNTGRLPISYKDVLDAAGSDNASIIEGDILSLRKAEKAFTQAIEASSGDRAHVSDTKHRPKP